MLTKFRSRVITVNSIAAVCLRTTRRGTAWRGAARRAAHTGAVQGGSVSVESRTRDVGTKGVGREGSIDPGGSRSERRTPSVAAQPAAPSRAPAPFEPAKCISDNDDGDRRRRRLLRALTTLLLSAQSFRRLSHRSPSSDDTGHLFIRVVTPRVHGTQGHSSVIVKVALRHRLG